MCTNLRPCPPGFETASRQETVPPGPGAWLAWFALVIALLPAAGMGQQPEDPRPIVHVHDSCANPFLSPLNGAEVGDPFPVHWDGVWHLYALEGGLRSVLHFTSTDLVNWTEHQPAMTGEGIATGTVVRHDNKFYLFYTDAGPQSIRLGVSDNPWHFDFAKSQLVAKADEQVYQLNKHKFRDCYVFYHDTEKLWWMLVEATSDDTVAVGLFKSEDLLTWTQHDPIFKDKSRVHASCPQVFQERGRWYLTCLDYGTWYYEADVLSGPWNLRGKYHSKYMTAASRHATDGQRRLCWGFFAKYPTPEKERGGYGGPLGVGRELVFDQDGKVGVRPLPELIATIRKPADNADLFDCARGLSGQWELDAVEEVFHSTNERGGVLLLDLPEENPDYYMEAEITLSRPEATAAVVVRASESLEQGYRVVMQPAKKRVAICESAAGGGTFDESEHAFSGDKTVHLQVFVCNGFIEAFIDGYSTLRARIVNRSEHRVMIEISGSVATIRKLLLHYFKPRKTAA